MYSKPLNTAKLLIALIVILLIAVCCCFIFFRRSTADMKYLVYCDDERMQLNREDHMYETGSIVEVVFPVDDTDIEYEFDVAGVDSFDVSSTDESQIIITFTMGRKPVSVYCYVKDTFQGISITLDENPTTGFEWQYQISPEGIIQVVEDRYQSDPYDGEPVDGLGGTRYFKFKVIGTGIVEIAFNCTRGDEQLYDSNIIYRYECDGTNAKLIE